MYRICILSNAFGTNTNQNLSLGEDGESLVKPEVLKVEVGHQVPRPGVGYLMG